MDSEDISGSKSNPKPDPGKIITFNLWSTRHGKRAESFYHSLTTTRPQPLINVTTAGFIHKITVFRAYIQRNSLKYPASIAHQLLAKLFPKACSADHQMD